MQRSMNHQTQGSRATGWPSRFFGATPDAGAACLTAMRIRREVLRDTGYGPIRDLTAVTEAAGAHVVEADLAAGAGGCEALLVPVDGDRFRIAVDPTPRSG
jgi:hypothetical protein